MMIITTIISAFVIVAVVLLIEWRHLIRNKQKEKTKISFKEGLDLTELPIVTFYQGAKKLHFLLDTGSNISYINKDVLKDIKAESLNASSCTFGVEGGAIETLHYLIKIGYKDQEFEEEFGAVDLSGAFGAIEKASGIKLHGIIGNRFFEKYKYILDFKELIAYR
jgi:hypothetical protein